MVVDKNSWTGNLQGKLRIPITSAISQYTINLDTDRPVTTVTFWEGTLTGSGSSFTFQSPSYFSGKNTGDILEHGFQVAFPGDIEPRFTSIKLNGVDLCTGEAPIATTAEPVATTLAPLATTLTPVASTSTPVATTTAPVAPGTTGPTGPNQCSAQPQDYAEALRLSLLFYEAQRSGPLPSSNRVPWRGDSSTGDRGNAGEDLTGGYHDAGDYVKFGYPMAGAMTILAYGGISYATAYEAAGQMGYLKDAVKWGTDYIIKAHVSPEEFYCQVGNGDVDHAYPGRPETMSVARPAYSLTPSRPGSDCAGESAAALASASVLFADSDPAYSATLIEHAKQLFSFADDYRGIYSNSISDAAKFYK